MQKVLFERTGQIGRITLNRPEVLNAIDDEVPALLSRAVTEANADPQIHAIILSGNATGHPVDRAELARVRERVGDARILIGSGLDERNASELLPLCNGAIVGTTFKVDGRVENPVDPNDPGVQSLFETLEWINGFEDTGEMYRARLLALAQGESNHDSSRLGLIRVTHEGACRLTAEVEDHTLAVIATFNI